MWKYPIYRSYRLYPSKGSFKGANKLYTFCVNCGEVDSIRIENTTIFKK